MLSFGALLTHPLADAYTLFFFESSEVSDCPYLETGGMDANGHGNDMEAALGRAGVVVLVPSPAPAAAPASASGQTDMRTAKMKERHKMNGGLLRDFIIGFADGLTVPFALTAGLSSYVVTKFSGKSVLC